MNDLDGERKKWSIAFKHIKNQSIGEWEEYKWYIDPKTRAKVRLEKNETPPDDIINNKNVMIYKVSKFQDFLMKTSFMDLDYILWRILCATAMEKEIVSIDCKARDDYNNLCGNHYDWVYSPSALLQMDKIDPAVLDDMKKTAEVNDRDGILAWYNKSALKTNNTVKLSSSGISVVFGHISAYDYLEKVYGEIQRIRESEDNDPSLMSEAVAYTTLSCVKAFLIPKPEGGYSKVASSTGIVKIINSLNEVDWQTVGKLVNIMITPYQFTYALKDIVCPKCKNKSDIVISNIAELLFIVARSLSSVNVELKSSLR